MFKNFKIQENVLYDIVWAKWFNQMMKFSISVHFVF